MLDIEFVLKGKGVISVEIKFSQPQPGRNLSFNEDEETRINLNEDGARGRKIGRAHV